MFITDTLWVVIDKTNCLIYLELFILVWKAPPFRQLLFLIPPST